MSTIIYIQSNLFLVLIDFHFFAKINIYSFPIDFQPFGAPQRYRTAVKRYRTAAERYRTAVERYRTAAERYRENIKIKLP